MFREYCYVAIFIPVYVPPDVEKLFFIMIKT